MIFDSSRVRGLEYYKKFPTRCQQLLRLVEVDNPVLSHLTRFIKRSKRYCIYAYIALWGIMKCPPERGNFHLDLGYKQQSTIHARFPRSTIHDCSGLCLSTLVYLISLLLRVYFCASTDRTRRIILAGISGFIRACVAVLTTCLEIFWDFCRNRCVVFSV